MAGRFGGARGATAMALALATTPAWATNGYFSHGYSAAQRALGGTGSAYATDALAASSNPANLAYVPERFDLNLGLFMPQREYLAGERGPNADAGIFTIEPGTSRSARERFGIPAMAYNRPSADGRWSWGLALYGNGGMNTDYRGRSATFAQNLPGFEVPCTGTFGGGAPVGGASDNAGFCGNGADTASVDLIQLFVVPSYALRLGGHHAVGVAPIFAAQRFTAKGLKAFARFSNAPDQVSDTGYDYSYGGGYRLGLTSTYFPYTTIGASYQSRLDMSPFDKYAGLFAGQGDFDIPATWNAGLALRLPWRQRLLFDYQKVYFDQVAAVGNPLNPNRFVNECAMPRLGGDSAPSAACLGANTGPGFGWRDVTTRKFGYEIATGALRWRAGYSKNDQPIPSSEVLFNILAPAVPQEHYTAGLSYPLTPAWALELSLMYAHNHAVRGKNPLSNATVSGAELAAALAVPGSVDTSEAFGADADDQDLTLDMRQYEVMLGWSYRFD